MVADKEKKIANLLGLAERAGRLASGGFAAEKALEGNSVCGILVAGDAAESTCEKYKQLAEKNNVPLFRALPCDIMGQALGKDGKRAVVAVTDKGFWQALVKLIVDEVDS